MGYEPESALYARHVLSIRMPSWYIFLDINDINVIGQVMAQWDPAATSYTYPISMVELFTTRIDMIEWWFVLQSRWHDVKTIPKQSLLCSGSGQLHCRQRDVRAGCYLPGNSLSNNIAKLRLSFLVTRLCLHPTKLLQVLN
jgi:hypothetical protein